MPSSSAGRPSPTEPVPPLGVVVVNYAAADLLRATLAPLPLTDAVVVVVDNYSGDAERARITALAQECGWQLVPAEDNRGFGPGVNLGVARARALGCDAVLLLNPDAEVDAATVAELHRAVSDRPRALVSPLLVDNQGAVTFAGSLLDLADGRTRGAGRAEVPPRLRRPVGWITAACIACSLDLWDEVGGFAEDYFLYWEDVDFSFRCRAAGAELVVRDDLRVRHDQGGTQGPRAGRAKSSLYYFYNARNRMLFATRHLDRADVWHWLWRTPAISRQILLRGGRRQLLESPGRVVAVARGAGAGMLLGLRALVGRRSGRARPVTTA